MVLNYIPRCICGGAFGVFEILRAHPELFQLITHITKKSDIIEFTPKNFAPRTFGPEEPLESLTKRLLTNIYDHFYLP